MNPDASLSHRKFLASRYQELWDSSIGNVRAGQATLDPLLASGWPDQRRSLTVLLRPSAEVRGRIADFLGQLREMEPEQYYYRPGELHTTVLSLFTGTVDHASRLARYDDYLAAVTAALDGAPSFRVEYTGVTLSREAILIQGFPTDSVLEDLRQKLRTELRSRGLTDGLDTRYVLKTAHLTVVRFKNPLRHPEPFANILDSHRHREFGHTEAEELHLVKNDWYMSTPSVEILRKFPLDANKG